MARKLTVIFPNIQPGGTERVINLILPKFKENFKVRLMALAAPDRSSIDYKVHTVELIPFKGGMFKRYFSSIVFLVKELKNTGRLLVFGEVPIILVALSSLFIRQKLKTIACVRNHESTFFSSRRFSNIRTKIFSWALNKYDSITANSDSIKKDLIDNFYVRSKIHVIYNPVVENNVSEKGHYLVSTAKPFKILNIGRLEEQKGQIYLIKAVLN